jgi:hypothetical protein
LVDYARRAAPARRYDDVGDTAATNRGGALVSATEAGAEDSRGPAVRLGFAPGQLVVELGYDDDCDDLLRSDIEAVTGSALADDDIEDVADVVLLWWRQDDGDLVDALVDALTLVDDGGLIWLLTPKAARAGHVEPSDINEAAPTAGLSTTKSTAAAAAWSGTRLVAPRVRR